MRQFTRGRKEGQAAAGNYAGWENIQAWPAPAISKSRLPVNIPALLHKLYRLLFHTFAECGLLVYAFFRGEVAHVLGDFHRAETRAAHRAEVRDLAGLLLALMQELGSLGYAFIRSPDITAGHRSILSVLVHNYRNYETGHAHDP